MAQPVSQYMVSLRVKDQKVQGPERTIDGNHNVG